MSVLAESDLLTLLIALALAILVTTLHLVLAHALRRRYLELWTIGWSILAVCLAIQLALRIGSPQLLNMQHVLSSVAAYGFSAALLLGCRCFATDRPPERAWVFCLLMLGLPGLALPLLAENELRQWLPPLEAQDASQVLCESAIQSVLAAFALIQLSSPAAKSALHGGLGRRVLVLSLLTAMFFELLQVGLLLFAWRDADAPLVSYVLASNRFELAIDLLAAFGCIMLALDSVRQELEKMNADLAGATQRLEKLASQDALTHALNRHAFYMLLEGKRPAADSGSVAHGSLVVLDVDRLKPINDELGHAAGDAVIRLVAKAVRALIRADDLLFRWGGDEFLVILPNVAPAEAESRFARLNDLLAGSQLPGAKRPIDLRVSAGIAGFDGKGRLEEAIAAADAQMLLQKEAGRRMASSSQSRPAAAPAASDGVLRA